MSVRTPYPPIPADQLRHMALHAEACLRLEAARDYGFVAGGPGVNVDRCEEVIAEAQRAGHAWTDEEIEAAVTVLVAQLLGVTPDRERLAL